MKKDLNLSIINPILNGSGQRYSGSGEISITSSDVSKKVVTGKDLVLQRIVIAIMMTPGTIIESDSIEWGGNIKKIISGMPSINDIDLKIEVSDLVTRVSDSIIIDQEDFGEYKVESISVINIEKHQRGFTANISVRFVDGSFESVDFVLPNIINRKRAF